MLILVGTCSPGRVGLAVLTRDRSENCSGSPVWFIIQFLQNTTMRRHLSSLLLFLENLANFERKDYLIAVMTILPPPEKGRVISVSFLVSIPDRMLSNLLQSVPRA